MKRRLAILLGLSCLACLKSVAIGETAALGEATRALQENLPEVALVKVEQALAAPLDEADRPALVLKLAEAKLALGRADDALIVLQQNRAIDTPEASFWRGRIFAAQSDWDRARKNFHEAANDPAWREAARLGEAQALDQLGDRKAAVQLLAAEADRSSPAMRLRLAELYLLNGQVGKCRDALRKIPTDDPGAHAWEQYLEARANLAAGNAARAYFNAQELLRAEANLPEDLVAGATLVLADAMQGMQGPEAATVPLERFLAQRPASPQLGAIFDRLDRAAAHAENPSAGDLKKWAQLTPEPRAAFAQFYLARAEMRQKQPEKAAATLDNFLEKNPAHELTAAALLLRAEIAEQSGASSAAALAFYERAMPRAHDPALLAEIERRAGAACFRLEQFVRAATYFESAATHDEAHRADALYNEALCWLQQGSGAKLARTTRDLRDQFPDSPWITELELERALLQARRGTERANDRSEDALEEFTKKHPDHPRVMEARLALAEQAFQRGAPSKARIFVRVANDLPLSPEDRARVDYLGIFATDREANGTATALEDCKAFLAAHPGAAQVPEVRMKLAQIYFRTGDFANAQTQLETLADESPNSPLAECALFLAGQAAMRTMNNAAYGKALELFGAVAQLNGPLKLRAWHEQAVVKRALGDEAEAVVIWDRLLEANPTGEVRWSAMAGKGNALFAMGANDETCFEKSRAAFDSLAREAGLPATWRNQALYREAECLQRLQRQPEALAVLYDVVDHGAADGPDYFWFYKAGFDAARLVAEAQNWPGAIALYEKLSAIDGPRSAEARDEMRRIRLEHFVWEK